VAVAVYFERDLPPEELSESFLVVIIPSFWQYDEQEDEG
jgi:hypothetical protein